MRNGFRYGMVTKTVLGLACLAPRPLIYAIKGAVGSYRAIVPAEGEVVVSDEDKRLLEAGLAVVSETAVPLRLQAT